MAAAACPAPGHALPPVPAPLENPVTEPKRVLGKILFWDEQLSSDNTVACGTCHQPRFGGGDGRRARNPGPDGRLGTEDDGFGSPGIFHLSPRGVAKADKVFGRAAQVGTRTSPSFFGSLWSKTAFWDGRAGSEFKHPVTGHRLIKTGGALEAQAVAPIVNAVEMAQERRAWTEVTASLAAAKPLAVARRLPPDVLSAIEQSGGSYPRLFARAFGDGSITPARIAFAIATYERTLVADRTPWDDWKTRGAPLPPAGELGFAMFQRARCDACHIPPLFMDDRFFNIGVRPSQHDLGRQVVTDRAEDAGRMKVPTLRNAALRTSFTHTGEFTKLEQVLDLYATPAAPRDTLPDGSEYLPRISPFERTAIEQFIVEVLTDPRVAKEEFPFDRPQLRSERVRAGEAGPERPAQVRAAPQGAAIKISWTAPVGHPPDDYLVFRNGALVARTTQNVATDATARPGRLYRYQVIARNAGAVSSKPAAVWIATKGAWLWPIAVGAAVAILILALRHRLGKRAGADRSAEA